MLIRARRFVVGRVVPPRAVPWGWEGRCAARYGGSRGATIHGDPEGLARVVRNLLENAVRYARDRVELSLTERDGPVELSVADDGPGVPAAARERVFERFARLDEGRARDTGGTGLGLAIVREVVVAHGASVTLDGGPGARFVVSLPRTSSGG